MKRLGLLSSLVLITTLTISVLLSSPVLSNEKRGIHIRNGRYALVIGNGAYSASPLKNPVNDSMDMARLLEQLGFTVMHRHDVGLREMETSVREFGHMLETGGTGLFYYAGHGMQVEGRNYLIPVDAIIKSQSDVRFEALDVGRVLGKMEDAGNGLNIVILDACRDNPFANGFRSARSGLARMDAPSGTLIAYATAPGSVAEDGNGRNGVYTKNLLAHIATPGLPVEQVFKHVRIGVIRDTNQKQVPWEASSLTGDFYFAPAMVDKTTEYKKEKLPNESESNDEVVFWESIKDRNDLKLFQDYLSKYPNGDFSDLAKIEVERLKEPKAEKTTEKATQITGTPLIAYAKDVAKTPKVHLRSISRRLATESDIKSMLTNYGFYDRVRNPYGSFKNELLAQNEEIAIDQKTGLMWQRTGSLSRMSFVGAKSYIEELNEKKFAGYTNWRLPTIEELSSTLTPQKNADLYVSPTFSSLQKICWSNDENEKHIIGIGKFAVWVVDYEGGKIDKAIWFIGAQSYYNVSYSQKTRNYVRAVRSIE